MDPIKYIKDCEKEWFEKTEDPTQKKLKVSEFGNNVYDQLWAKSGSPSNILSKINLVCSESKILKEIIMGNPVSQHYDGLHLHGGEGHRCKECFIFWEAV